MRRWRLPLIDQLSKNKYLFLAVFFSTVATHSLIWDHVLLVDRLSWSQRIAALSQLELMPFHMPFFANPGMATISVGALIKLSGFSSDASLTISLVLLTAVGIAGIVTLIYRLRPQSWWWLIAGFALIFHETYVDSAPHDVVTATYILCSYLLALYIFEHPASHWRWSLLLGITAGIVMATYVAIGLLLLLPLFYFMYSFLNFRKLFLTITTTAIIWLLFDPLWLFMPTTHGQMIVKQIINHSVNYPSIPLAISDLLVVAPLSIMGFLLGTFQLFFPQQLSNSLPRPYLLLLVAVSVLATTMLLAADYQTFRLFHSLFLIWSAVLPLLFLDLMNKIIKNVTAPTVFLTLVQVLFFSIAAFKEFIKPY